MKFITFTPNDLPYLVFYTGMGVFILIVLLLVYTGRREGHLI